MNPEFLCKLSFEGSIKNIIKERIEKLKPTAILAVNEPISINVVQALGELNLKIPEDISLIIYDDLSWARLIIFPRSRMLSIRLGHRCAR